MRIVALLLCFAASCATAEGLKNPPPVTEADYVVLDAMISHGAELLVGDGDPLEESWAEDVALGYLVARAVAGNPVFPNEGESIEEAAFREMIDELVLSATGQKDVLAEEDWARSAVRIYGVWRALSGDPVAGPSK